jgi:hypothetical protein
MAKGLVFRTQFDKDTGNYKSEPGSKLLPKYAMRIDEKTGYEYLAPTGEYENVYDHIQADYPSTDINILMQRFALGDTSALDVKPGFFADVTKMPSSYAEMFEMYQDCHRYFDELPTDLKEMFNNSFTEFFAEMDSDSKSFNKKIDEYNSRFELSPEYDVPEKSDPDVEKGAE